MKDCNDELAETSCPFCDSHEKCEHVLLVVDTAFRTAEGGVLEKAFNKRWCVLCEAGGDDFDEREPFDNLLEEVDSLADTSTEYDDEGGPGLSSRYVVYFVSSETEAQIALAHFTAQAPSRDRISRHPSSPPIKSGSA